jgi:hypothetical protein
MTPNQFAALFRACAELGQPFDAALFRPDGEGSGYVGAFVGPAYIWCSPYGEVELWCDCEPGVPYGSCKICAACGCHMKDCQANRCQECRRCETVCIKAGCPGY